MTRSSLSAGVAYVQYTHPSCAAYAREKLNAFEYPPGFRISVRYPPNQASYSGYTCVPLPLHAHDRAWPSRQ